MSDWPESVGVVLYIALSTEELRNFQSILAQRIFIHHFFPVHFFVSLES